MFKIQYPQIKLMPNSVYDNKVFFRIGLFLVSFKENAAKGDIPLHIHILSN